MDYLRDSPVSIYRRRQRQRAVVTMTFVAMLLLATLVYASANVDWGANAAPSAASAGCVDTSGRALTPSDVTLNVYNTTSRAGLAAIVAAALEKQGFRIATVDNDPLGQTLLGIGQIRYGLSGAAAAAIAAARFPGATLVQDDRPDGSVDVAVGARFRGLSAPTVTGSKAAKTAGSAENRCRTLS